MEAKCVVFKLMQSLERLRSYTPHDSLVHTAFELNPFSLAFKVRVHTIN